MKNRFNRVDEALDILHEGVIEHLPVDIWLDFEIILQDYLSDCSNEDCYDIDQDIIISNIEDLLDIDLKNILGKRTFDKLYYTMFEIINK